MVAWQQEWVQTFTGKRMRLWEPRADDVDIRDIAHALSLQCRFGGHTSVFVSVAQHSVMVSQCCDKKDALWGLLHDAAEAYVGDMCRPLKNVLNGLTGFGGEGYASVEAKILGVVAGKFGLEMPIPASVKVADDVLLASEARDFMRGGLEGWAICEKGEPDALGWRITAWSSEAAEAEFMARFEALGGVC